MRKGSLVKRRRPRAGRDRSVRLRVSKVIQESNRLRQVLYTNAKTMMKRKNQHVSA
jgi:hypothetical protein